MCDDDVSATWEEAEEQEISGCADVIAVVDAAGVAAGASQGGDCVDGVGGDISLKARRSNLCRCCLWWYCRWCQQARWRPSSFSSSWSLMGQISDRHLVVSLSHAGQEYILWAAGRLSSSSLFLVIMIKVRWLQYSMALKSGITFGLSDSFLSARVRALFPGVGSEVNLLDDGRVESVIFLPSLPHLPNPRARR